jgi:hypothetical protein
VWNTPSTTEPSSGRYNPCSSIVSGVHENPIHRTCDPQHDRSNHRRTGHTATPGGTGTANRFTTLRRANSPTSGGAEDPNATQSDAHETTRTTRASCPHQYTAGFSASNLRAASTAHTAAFTTAIGSRSPRNQ